MGQIENLGKNLMVKKIACAVGSATIMALVGIRLYRALKEVGVETPPDVQDPVTP